jgi:hypothetical protein
MLYSIYQQNHRIALFVIHFGKLPEKIDPEEINEYLAALAREPNLPREAVSNIWCSGCAIIIACWV